MIYRGDCLEVMKTLQDNSVDAVITDPPYELNFMGKKWDNTGIANNIEMWVEVLRILKHGGHLLAFGGTRTQHRMVCAIEDAGFQIRNQIVWAYGSGFPKSLNIGKKIDEMQGNEREVVGHSQYEGRRPNKSGGSKNGDICYGDYKAQPEMLVTKGNSDFEGWGTDLKPAFENICLAQKPFESSPVLCYIISCIINNITEALKCQKQLNVKTAELSSKLNRVEPKEDLLNIAVWNAENNTNIQENLSVLMDILPLKKTECLNLNIVSLCLNFLKEICSKMNTYTIETESSLIIDLKILNLFLSVDTLKTIIHAQKINQDGKIADVSFVENYLKDLLLKWKITPTPFVQETVILKGENLNFAPNLSPICVARKPLEKGLNVAQNCLKWGCGGLNIDGCRVKTTEELNYGTGKKSNVGFKTSPQNNERPVYDGQDRFPSNLILDDSEEVRACFPETKSGDADGNRRGHGKSYGDVCYGDYKGLKTEGGLQPNSGNASRFFKSIIYQAKASKAERNFGCEGLEKEAKGMNFGGKLSGKGNPINIGTNKNFHPTVKPVALMEYLINLITRAGQTVLDPFTGSGTTGVACKKLGREFIGIELNPEYIEIAEKRIAAHKSIFEEIAA